MGKLHKIRHDYNKLTEKDKKDLKQMLCSSVSDKGTRQITHAFYDKYSAKWQTKEGKWISQGLVVDRSVKYYILHLLKKDGILKKTQRKSFYSGDIAKYY